MRDPAFLFYPGDWLGGTMILTRHQKGCYLDVLMAQFNSGPLSLESIKTILGQDQAVWTVLQSKFKQTAEGLYFNERLATEIEKRKKYSESRRQNKLAGTKKQSCDSSHDERMLQHTENEDENRNKDLSKKKKGGVGEKNKKPKKAEPEFPEFQDCMAAYHEFYKSLTGVSPSIKVQDGKALKDLILHFRSIANEGQSIVDGFRYVFKNWQKLDPFYQKQIDITRIYTNINPIISELKTKRKNANSNTGNTDYESAEFKRSVDEKIDKIFAER